MSEPAQRASRSRYSSPFATTPQNAANAVKAMTEPAERPRTFMDKWIEPQLAPPRPSFAEAGIERHGVVANMAPLGTRPSAKVVKASARPESAEPMTRSSTRRAGASSVSTPSEPISTPEPMPSTLRRRSLSAKADHPEPTPQTPQTPQPQTPQTPQAGARKSLPRPSPARQQQGQSVFALQQSPLPLGAPRMVHSYIPPPSQFGPNGEYRVDLDMTDRVVEMAVQEALDHRRWPTAYALRTLYDDHRLNPRMVRLIDTIYNGRADDNQLKEFRSVMRHKKKEGKKDRAGEYYFNGDGSDPLPSPGRFDSVEDRTPSLSGPQGRAATGARSPSDAHAAFSVSSASASVGPSVSASPSKDTEHISKKHKSNRFAPLSLEMNGGAAHVKSTPPPKHAANGGRARTASNTSTSSLSSVDEHVLNNDEYRTSPAGARAHPPSRSAHAETQPGARSATRPITASQESGPKTYTFSTVTTSSALPSSSSSSAAAAAAAAHAHDSAASGTVMPPAALLSLSAAGTPSSPFKGKKDLAKVTGRAFDENEPALRMKRKAREVTNKSIPVRESFERRRRGPPEPESASDRGDSLPPAPPKRTNIRLLNKKTRQSHARNYDSDGQSSPTVLSFQPDLAPGSLSVSRAGTPSTSTRPVRKAKAGTGLRVKTSPVKKKGGGPLAGLPRQSGERNSPTGNGGFNNMDENDDYCCACGGGGDLVCCDSCNRSLHFNCVDPPMSEDALPDEWFCNNCVASRIPRRHESETGMFGSLLANLSEKNPYSFSLPEDVREYFVDVKTGAEGEYDSSAPAKPKNRGGYEEAPDYFRLKDTKGKAILCHQCHRSASAPSRSIIPCTYCGLYWHLDCLDTPLAKEPGPGKPFRCPAHIDDLLATIPASLAPAHRFRRIKGAPAIRPAVSRGVQNNGHIEIENEPTDDEKELGFYEQREFGHVYKLPELGIKLDFISQVRRQTGGRGGYAPLPVAVPENKPNTWDQRTLVEQQAVLNLASLAIPHPEIGDPKTLIDALLSEASPAVLALIAQGDSRNIAESNLDSNKDRTALVALRALIDSKLGASPSSASAPAEPALSKAASPAIVNGPTSPSSPAAPEVAPQTPTNPPAIDGESVKAENGHDSDTEMSD